MNTCAVVVTYFPDQGFPNRLRAIHSQVGHVIVVDNASGDESFSHVKSAELQLGCEVIRNTDNLGIATALNQGMKRALDGGFEWALLLDQDTTPSEKMVQTLSEAYEEFPHKDRLALIGSSYFSHPDLNNAPQKTRSWVERKTVITSGSLIPLATFNRIGPFRDELFIDCVDFEYCLRARSVDLTVIEVTTPVMQHRIGNPKNHRLPWAKRESSHHCAWRWYYMNRNHAFLVRKYVWKEPVWVLKAAYSRIRLTVLMLLWEESRLTKLKYALIGLFDSAMGRFGRRFT
jgi:rhamnosyltransferase